jgi:hypothetical protein
MGDVKVHLEKSTARKKTHYDLKGSLWEKYSLHYSLAAKAHEKHFQQGHLKGEEHSRI